MSYTATPTTEFTEFWNSVLAPKFTRFRHILTTGMRHHGDVAIQGLTLPPEAKVLDIGCGWGDTTLQLAKKIGPEGEVLGIDCCDMFLEEGRKAAKELGLRNIEFLVGDAEVYPFERKYDLCFARFGTMFFTNPVSALRNLRKALKPNGQFVMVVWRVIDDNPFLNVAKQITLQFLPPPDEGAKTCGPGPFSMANREMVTGQLQAAGFHRITFTRVDGPVEIGKTAEEAIDFQVSLGPAGEIVREAGELAEKRRTEIDAALREELRKYDQGGKIVMGSSSWVISAAPAPATI